MRLCILLILTLFALGCGTVSPHAEREIALLRTEILDLGDQYGDLKSRHRRALADLAECRGEPIPEGWIQNGYPYYPEGGQIIDDGYIHLGTPDCCDQCSQIYYEDQPIGSAVAPRSLSPESQRRVPAVEPIETPFQDRANGANPNQSFNSRRDTLFSKLADSFSARRGRRALQPFAGRNQIPDAEPAFRPNSRSTTPRSDSRTSPNSIPELEVSYGEETPARDSGQMAWRKTSVTREQPLSSTPLDERFVDTDLGTSMKPISQIFIDPENTSATDYDKDGSSDGIIALVQPLDADGKVVNQAANLVVSLIDPSEKGDAQRIGLWKYQAYQTESFISTERGRLGLQLDLSWQRKMPKGKTLVLFVRYITEDGKSLDTSLDINISPPSPELEMNGPVARRQNSSRRTEPKESANVPTWRPVR